MASVNVINACCDLESSMEKRPALGGKAEGWNGQGRGKKGLQVTEGHGQMQRQLMMRYAGCGLDQQLGA